MALPLCPDRHIDTGSGGHHITPASLLSPEPVGAVSMKGMKDVGELPGPFVGHTHTREVPVIHSHPPADGSERKWRASRKGEGKEDAVPVVAS